MSKVAKRALPVGAPAKRGQLRSLRALRQLNAEKDAAAGAATVATATTAIIEGHVIAVDEPGMVGGMLAGGEAIEALRPAHIDAAWLKEACEQAPVAAAFVVVRPSGRHVLWGIFPGPEHADVRSDIVIRGREIKLEADALKLSARNARLTLDPEGNVVLKGRDVTSHARRVNRIKGGSIRLN